MLFAKPFIMAKLYVKPVAAKAQQSPQLPWSLTDVTALESLQSKEDGT